MWLNLSNFFTLIRALISPFIFFSIVNNDIITTLILLFVSALTDFLDGYIARHLNLQTTLGAYLDPLADKIFLLTCFIALGVNNTIPLWFVIIMLIRELIIILGVGIIRLLNKDVVLRPTIWGKLNTCLALIFIFFNLIHIFAARSLNILLFGVVLFAFFSLMHYVKTGIKLLQKDGEF